MLLQRLFLQMRRDDDTPQAIKDLLGTLQPAVLRVAREDTQLVSTSQHPAWRLFDQLAAQASGYAQLDIDKLNRFIDFITPHIQSLVPPPGPTAQQFQSTLDAVQDFVDADGQQQLQTRPQALAELQKADQRLSLQPMLRQQVQHQIEGVRMKPRVRDFLLGPWVDVMSQAMCQDGLDPQGSESVTSVVDDLIQSLRRPESERQRAALRNSLPDLIGRLRDGMASIEMPQAEQEAVLKDLMGIHSHHLLAPLKPAAPVSASASPADIVQQLREEAIDEEDVADAAPLTAPPSTFDTNIGALPTVPMSFVDHQGTATELAPEPWLTALRPNTWCKVFLQGRWTTAKLLWVSDNHQFFMFTSNQAGRTHTLTRRALLRLRSEGLATRLDDRGLMQRAVDRLMARGIEQR